MTIDHRNAPGRNARDTASWQALAGHLEREAVLLHELGASLVVQRAAVGAGDAGAVNANVEAIGRMLLAIEESRAAREGLLGSMPGSSGDDLSHLEAVFGDPLPASLAALRGELRRRAEVVAREARINQQVLARSMEAGEAFLVTLFSAIGEPSVAYARPSGSPPPPRGAGVLLNRKV